MAKMTKISPGTGAALWSEAWEQRESILRKLEEVRKKVEECERRLASV